MLVDTSSRFESLLKILGSEVPRSTALAVLCTVTRTESLVARLRGTGIRREVVLICVLSKSLGGNKDQ